MVKVLVGGNFPAGPIGTGAWEVLASRVEALQASQHGPFDLLLVCGSLFASDEQYKEALASEMQLKIPTYLSLVPSFVTNNGGVLPANVYRIGNGDSAMGLETISRLTVAYINSSISQNSASELDSIKSLTSAAAYRGCDVLLSDEWPKDMHHFIEESEYQQLQSIMGPGFLGLGSPLVVNVATLVRPRYHFSSGRCFFQRSPYRNALTPSSSVSSSSVATRFIGLGPVTESKEKDKKWLHALSLEPIVYMSARDLGEEPVGTTDSPYVSVGLKPLARPQQLTLEERVASQNAAKRIKIGGRGTGSGAVFFGHLGVPRPDSSFGGLPTTGGPAVNLVPPSATATTLFIGNLPRGVGIPQELEALLHGCVRVRIPEGKSFAFADFGSHEAALRMVENASRPGCAVNLQGRQLSIGWASSQSNAKPVAQATSLQDAGNRISRKPEDSFVAANQLAPPSADAKTVFLGGLPPLPISTESKLQAASEQPTLDGDGNVSDLDHRSLILTGALALRLRGLVTVRAFPGKAYAFAEFETHEAAAAAVTRHGTGAGAGAGAGAGGTEAANVVPLVLSGPPKDADGGTEYVLTVSWARERERSNNSRPVPSRVRVYAPQQAPDLTPPSQTARCLFVGCDSCQSADDASILAVFQTYLGGEDGLRLPSIRRLAGKNFAFLEFIGHSEALHALKSLAPSPSIGGKPATVGWAKGRGFERSDHSENCWFCLASPQLKAHLIASIAQHCYLAIPRGGMHSLHCLICPIECVPSRIHLPPEALNEMQQHEVAIEKIYRKHNFASLVFERCIRTQGKDHMQTQLVPVPAERVADALGVFLQVAGQHELKFREIEDDRGVDEVVVSMEGGPYQEYFYVSVPASMDCSKRFVFVLEEEPIPNNDHGQTKKQHRFPMLLGNEIAALVLGQPDKANWKNCVQSQEQEERLVEFLRKEFAEFEV